ncbi:MAG: hypothetical protein WBD48_16655 [Pseudolabrys sp.]|jgi:hypothetical protein
MKPSYRYAALAVIAAALTVPALAPAAANDEATVTVRHHRHHHHYYHHVYRGGAYAYQPRGEYYYGRRNGTFPSDCATEGSGGRVDLGACGGNSR